MTVGELLARISAAELTDWAAYEKIAGPLGPERADLHAGIIASTIANVNRGKRGKKYRPRDFMPVWDRPSVSDPYSMKTLLMSWSRRIRKAGES